MDKDIFVQNVKFWCEKRNVAPTVACKESGAGRDLLVNLQRGSSPSVTKVQLLAQYLGCTTSDLLGEEVGTQNSPPSEDGELHAMINALSPAGKKRAKEYVDFLLNLEEKP